MKKWNVMCGIEKTRESNFELIRIFSMLFIVFYYIIAFFVSGKYPENMFLQAVKAPLHMGVILFVLISGYFGIRSSLKGLLNFLIPVVCYFILFAVVYRIMDADMCAVSMHNTIYSWNFFPISGSPYWFVRSYLCLFLIAPVINVFLLNASGQERITLIVVLLFFSVYLGGIMHSDLSLADGKNILHFILLYVIGNTANYYRETLEKVPTKILFTIFFLLNLTILVAFSSSVNFPLRNFFWHMSFSYNGIILLFNASVFFILMSRFHFKNEYINNVAKSTFAVYLIHHHPLFLDKVIYPISEGICNLIQSSYVLVLSLAGFSLVIFSGSVIIDKICSPFFRFILEKMFSKESNHVF